MQRLRACCEAHCKQQETKAKPSYRSDRVSSVERSLSAQSGSLDESGAVVRGGRNPQGQPARHWIPGIFVALCCVGLQLALLPPPSLALIAASDPDMDTFENVPSQLSASGETAAAPLSSVVSGPKKREIEGCIRKCVPTCIRGGGGAPGLGPISVRKEIVVFKEGFRSRQYCLSECAQLDGRLHCSWWAVFSPTIINHLLHIPMQLLVLSLADYMVYKQIGPPPASTASPGLVLQYTILRHVRVRSHRVDWTNNALESTAIFLAKMLFCNALQRGTLKSTPLRLMFTPIWACWVITFMLLCLKDRTERMFGSSRDLFFIFLLFVAFKVDDGSTFSWRVVFLVPWMWFSGLLLVAAMVFSLLMCFKVWARPRELLLPIGFLLLLLSTVPQFVSYIALVRRLDEEEDSSEDGTGHKTSVASIMWPNALSWFLMWLSAVVIAVALRLKEAVRDALLARGAVWTAHEAMARRLHAERDEAQRRVAELSEEEMSRLVESLMAGKSKPGRLKRVGDNLYKRIASLELALAEQAAAAAAAAGGQSRPLSRSASNASATSRRVDAGGSGGRAAARGASRATSLAAAAADAADGKQDVVSELGGAAQLSAAGVSATAATVAGVAASGTAGTAAGVGGVDGGSSRAAGRSGGGRGGRAGAMSFRHNRVAPAPPPAAAAAAGGGTEGSPSSGQATAAAAEAAAAAGGSAAAGVSVSGLPVRPGSVASAAAATRLRSGGSRSCFMSGAAEGEIAAAGGLDGRDVERPKSTASWQPNAPAKGAGAAAGTAPTTAMRPSSPAAAVAAAAAAAAASTSLGSVATPAPRGAAADGIGSIAVPAVPQAAGASTAIAVAAAAPPGSRARSAPEVAEPDEPENPCVICYDGEATCVFLECGHGGFCRRCAYLMFVRPPSECPSCRATIEQVVEVEPGAAVGQVVQVSFQIYPGGLRSTGMQEGEEQEGEGIRGL
ncbi:hypothetical protein VOLCADRAFT_96168 [Volvox carteri f. nagariensis]|uniref:RING-type domain-containing protein n=1 Tax=Volvox carteri f. nagariensis TaxID=3068 RepID=D8U9E1_VOLCA|nr:uncharacterized protein VOLCADRAFT_96168 [Volvox carteri f. nagariensis]EFJ43568.1 hypothetical protein VOLCADRAFT_96168 [Volvox carteri f. nagariensis]|eukprot:XP_002955268.1 hypothetical protein VOLCADRAFT_96168 [Volvox carteri f. nagariensis]